MIKKLLVLVCLFAATLSVAQKKGPKVKKPPVTDSTGAIIEPEAPLDPMEALENTLPIEVELDPNTGKKIVHKDVIRRNDSLRKDLRDRIKKEKMSFRVWTKHPNPKAKVKERNQLCINIVHKDTFLIYSVNDSICMDPENNKLMFEKSIGDSTFMLILVDAFTKSDNELCRSGHETKLYFVRWNTKTMKANWKLKNICSCTKAINLMTKRKVINEWDKTTPLEKKYNRDFDFMEIKFDPASPQLGIQVMRDDGKDKKE
jgi:hypothetical protein